jgi:high affinity Mn2+ porin
MNHYDGGSYGAALQLAAATDTTPDVTRTLRIGTLKYGFGVNAEQEIAKGLGVFMRLGWNDGKNQSFEFTAIDRLASGGVSLSGARWNRRHDTVATEVTVSGLSAVHALYLTRGGLDFLIGDGRLNYAPEYVWESYYRARLFKDFFGTLDAQHINNPAYNHDRGPLWALSLRLHVEAGKK